MLNIPQQTSALAPTPYEVWGLRDLPFPALPLVNPYSPDDRTNGRIYAEAPVQHEIEKFERLLIRPNDFLNRVRVATLWAKGDTESGRGMGKTALLRFFQQRINHDWGATEFGGNFSAVVVYVAFPNQVTQRYMEQLSWAALVDVCKSNVLDAALAALRLQTLSNEKVEAIINGEGGQNYANLLDDEILMINRVLPETLNATVEGRLLQEGLEQASAKALAGGGFENYLRSLRRDGSLEPYYVPRDLNGLARSSQLFFNDIVLYLRSAGFAGGYLFVDDIENLTDQMQRRHRNAFVKNFGLCTVRPGYANTAYNFFSCVLTTHQSSAYALAQAWQEAGLASMVRLEPDAPTSVELPLPTQDQARQIIIAHLDHYRINPDEHGSINPFTEDGMNALVAQSQHPRRLLSMAANVMSHAVSVGINSIDANAIKEATSSDGSSPIVDYSEGIEGAI